MAIMRDEDRKKIEEIISGMQCQRTSGVRIMVLSNYAKQKILELKIILKTSKRKICNEKKIFLVFAFVLMSWGQASADFSFNYVSNDGTVNISGLLNTASNGNGTLPVTGGYFSGFENGVAISGTILGGTTTPPNYLSSPSGKFTYDNSLLAGSSPLLSTTGGLLFGNTSTNTETNIFYYNGAYSFSTYNPGTGYQPVASGWGIPGNFTVSPAPAVLTVVKSASLSPSVNPGQVVTYTETITNTGTGTATSVVVTDSLSPYVQVGLNSYGAGVAFQFVDGTPASGLTLGTPVYSNNNGSTWVYTPTSGGGGAPAGYDGSVTNWQIPMSGTMNANGANFTINYKVRVY
jgi:uncharacterized repeat protein (TIGR01451 family)